MTDPIDETQPHATDPSPPPASPPAAPTASVPGASQRAASSLRVQPDGPKATDWREPAWFPPADERRGPNRIALVAALGLVAVGLYLLIERTLGVAPILLIAIGAIILFRSVRRPS